MVYLIGADRAVTHCDASQTIVDATDSRHEVAP
jgi:hypothetical protein